MKPDRSKTRIGFLLGAIAQLMTNPLLNEINGRGLSFYKRELHITAGENPIFTPKRTKPKGYIKDVNRDNRYTKYKKYA